MLLEMAVASALGLSICITFTVPMYDSNESATSAEKYIPFRTVLGYHPQILHASNMDITNPWRRLVFNV